MCVGVCYRNNSKTMRYSLSGKVSGRNHRSDVEWRHSRHPYSTLQDLSLVIQCCQKNAIERLATPNGVLVCSSISTNVKPLRRDCNCTCRRLFCYQRYNEGSSVIIFHIQCIHRLRFVIMTLLLLSTFTISYPSNVEVASVDEEAGKLRFNNSFLCENR